MEFGGDYHADFKKFMFFIWFRLPAKTLAVKEGEQALLPPRGWNSYDSFSWIISEEEFLKNAEIVSQRLHPNGYEVHPLEDNFSLHLRLN